MSYWICPSCNNSINVKGAVWRCDNGHCYDVAKEGYVNLLLAHHKNSKEPGDNKAMVNARRSFLEKGFYQPLADALAGITHKHFSNLNEQQDLRFFDAGCGEGYYLNHISQIIAANNLTCTYSGIDISKNAVLKAAKKYQSYQFAVASTFHIPVPTGSQNAVLQIFAPSSSEEISRILKPSGIWITVNPAADHLYQLKQALYDQPAKHKESESNPDGFRLQDSQKLSFELNLHTPEDRANLLMMTPYYWTATEDKKQALINSLATVTTDFEVKVWVKG